MIVVSYLGQWLSFFGYFDQLFNWSLIRWYVIRYFLDSCSVFAGFALRIRFLIFFNNIQITYGIFICTKVSIFQRSIKLDQPITIFSIFLFLFNQSLQNLTQLIQSIFLHYFEPFHGDSTQAHSFLELIFVTITVRQYDIAINLNENGIFIDNYLIVIVEFSVLLKGIQYTKGNH